MKNKKIIIAVLLSFLMVEVNAEKYECRSFGVGGLCIDIEFVSMKDDFKAPSEYKFPDLVKINDYLLITKITVINNPGIFEKSKTAPNVTLKIDAYPFRLERKDIEQLEETRYSTVYIPSLKVNDVYELTYLNEWAYYEAKLNNQIIEKRRQFDIYPKKLFTDGDWKIEEKIEEFISYTTFINGEFRNNLFKVYSNSEIKNLETAGKNLLISELSLVFVALIGVLTIGTEYYLANRQIKEQKKFEVEKKKRTIENLIFEFGDNLQRVEDLIKKKEQYIKGEVGIPMFNFSTAIMTSVLSNGTIESPELNGKIYLLRYTYEMQNNFLIFMRFGLFEKKEHLKKIIDNLELMIDDLRSIPAELEEYLKTIK